MRFEYAFLAAGITFIIAAVLGKIYFLPIGIALIVVGIGYKKKH